MHVLGEKLDVGFGEKSFLQFQAWNVAMIIFVRSECEGHSVWSRLESGSFHPGILQNMLNILNVRNVKTHSKLGVRNL